MGVYVFGEPGMLLVKVGVSHDRRLRMQALKCFDKAAKGECLYWHEEANGMVERRAHRLLRSRYWLDGEWFVCGAEVAKAAIRRAYRTYEAERLAYSRMTWRPIPTRCSQLLAQARRERRALTEEEGRECEEAWIKFEAAGGQRRRRRCQRRAA